MTKLSKIAEQLKYNLFSGSETKRRMANNVVRMIIGDVATLYEEFRTHEGDGALFFNPSNPDHSQFLTLTDIQNDIALAQEVLDEDLVSFLTKLQNVVKRESGSGEPIVVMVSQHGMTVHVLDRTKIDEILESSAFQPD